MKSILDYMEWRDDLTLKQVKPGIIDYFILSLITIIDFRNVIDNNTKITLEGLCKLYFDNNPNIEKLGLIIPNQIIKLVKMVGSSIRFKDVEVENYICDISIEEEKQFSAMTFILPNEIFVGFSGTDDTIIGWKENLDMLYKEFIPAQVDAINYLNEIKTENKIKCGGHSKGGNLALVSSIYTKKTIEKVYCFDSPGVNKKIYESEEYRNILSKVVTILPDTSVIGRMFNIPEEVKIVKSNQNGVYQHDPFSWEINKNDFVYLDKPNIESIEIQNKVKEIIDEMSLEEKKGFSNSVYKILKGTNNYALLDLEGKVLTLIKGYFQLPKEDKAYLVKPYHKLGKISFFKKIFLKGFITYYKKQKSPNKSDFKN